MFPITQICRADTGEAVNLEIGLAEELATLAFAVNRGELSGRKDVTVRLTADMDLTGIRWVPIGFGDSEFAGVFDGCGHTVRGMTLQKDGPGNYGLFGAVSGTVQNLTVAGEIRNVTGDPHSAVGGIAGELSGGVVKNCAAEITVDCRGEPLGFFAGGSVSGGCKAVGGIAGWISMDHQGPDPLTVVDCCLTLGDVIQSPNSSGGSCGGIVGEIYNKPPDTTLLLVRNCVCLGSLILRDPAGRAHPIVAHADGAVFENNYFDQRLPIQGDGVPQEQVAQGCTAWPAEKLLAELPALDSRCIIGPDGALTVRNLEIGGGI